MPLNVNCRRKDEFPAFLYCAKTYFMLYIYNPLCESSSGVEHHLAKVRVAGSNPVFRSVVCSDGGIGRHVGLKIQWPSRPCGFKSRSEYLENPQLIVLHEVADFFIHFWQHIGNKSMCFMSLQTSTNILIPNFGT